LKGHSYIPSWLYKLTKGNFVTNKTLFTFQNSQWLKFARCLCNAKSRCLSTTDFRRWSIITSHNKQNNSPSTCRVLSCSIMSCQIRQEGGNLPTWSKKQWAFSLRFLSVALSVSFNWFSTKKTTFCRKASNTPILPTNISHSDWLIWTKASLC